MKSTEKNGINYVHSCVLGLIVFLGLFITSRYNYLVFHTLSEFFSVVVAWSLFIIVWNTRNIIKQDIFLFIGIAYLFIGGLDLFHTISYKGMGVLTPERGANPATQLWVIARYMESMTLLLVPVLFFRRLSHGLIFFVYFAVTFLSVCSIFYLGIFPACYIDGEGLTLFKKTSEYLIILILAVGLILLYKKRLLMDQTVFKLMSLSIIMTMLAELSFTFYVSVYGLSNLVGHFFKIISFYLIYKALIDTGLSKPYKLLFNELNEREERYRQTFETNQAIKLIIDPRNGHIVEANDAACKYYGYSKENLLSLNISDINALPPENVKLEMERAKILKKQVFNFQHKLASGEIREVEVFSGPLEYGQHKLLYSIIHDVTDQKHAMETLHLSEEKHKEMIANISDVIGILDADGKILYKSPNIKKWFGWEPEDLIGTDGWGTVHPEDIEYIQHEFNELLKKHGSIKKVEYRYKNKSGSYQWIELTAVNLIKNSSINGVLMNYKDITERRHDRENLKLNDSRYQKAQKLGKVGNWEYNFQTTEFWGSDQVKRIYGFDPDKDKFTTDEVEDCIPERERVHQALIDLIEKEKEYNLEFDIISKNDKNRKTIISIAELEKDEKGNPLKVTGVIHDITALRKSSEELETKNEQLKTIFKAAKNVAFIITDAKDPEPSVLEFSPGAEKIFGYSRDEIIGKSVSILHLPGDVKKFPEAHHQMREGKTGFSGEVTLVRKSGENFPALFSTYPLLDQNGEMYAALGVSLDISEQKMLEKRVLQAQKMESIGNLAGGIAHDFNNLLYPIIGMSELLMEDLPPNSPAYENVQEIFSAGKRGGDLVKQILSFSRQEEHRLIPVRIQKVLNEALKLIKSSIPANIEVIKSFQQDCGLVMADPTQLHQIIMNLVTNAYHAVANHTDGKIKISLKEIALGTDIPQDISLPSGKYALLSVLDNGTGIPSEHLYKIFEPYFTTKEKGRGTGLGLSVAFGIVKEHNGDIKAYSDVGKGTTFDVYLPLMKNAGVETTVSMDAEILPMGNEKILLVDDETSIVHLETKMLERLGYKVTPHVNSQDALMVFKADPHIFDLVITDMTMPNMTGDKFSEKIMGIRSDIPVIVCTGFSEKMSKEQAEKAGIKGYLMKPLMKAELAKIVRKVLDEAKIS